MKVLVSAWHEIRRNAETSQTEQTKQAALRFGENLPRKLRQLQDRLRDGYEFSPAFGATPPKGKGKTGKRPIVVAPLEDRIVQRAILDVLQDAKEVPDVQAVLATKTSIGGIRGRGVDHAIQIFAERVEAGDKYAAGSDISGFFQKIRPRDVVTFLIKAGVERDFVELVKDALTVELINESQLSSEDRALFPTGEDGVAQGCPLSALAGNIVLHEFDERMNDRGITCIRYIDDFIIVGKSRRSVEAAMKAAKVLLAKLNMDIYDPATSPKKAFSGPIDTGHEFLGYQLIPGRYPPSKASAEKFLAGIGGLINEGKRSIKKAVADRKLNSRDRCYVQTLASVDNAIGGWRGSFKSSVNSDDFVQLDDLIDRRLHDFRKFYLQHLANQPSRRQRRALGVRLLSEPR
ncbi:MAG: hypothetical protein C0520_08055 [Sphingopyxis sp.]|nr:hypothetical protein [Sphingopyxis sp.]